MPGTTVPSTIYHITLWKAGSQWVQGVLRDLMPDRVIVPAGALTEEGVRPDVEPGAIYSPMYVHRLRFDQTPFAAVPHRKFLVIRDLRDVLVSWYFSLHETHGENPVVLLHRRHLKSLSVEAGLLYLLNHPDFYGLAMICSTWLDATDILTVRFEEMVERPAAVFARICEYCRIDADQPLLDGVLRRRSFQALSGRSRGSEGPASHYRRGVAGDWECRFTETIRREFSRRYDDLIWRCGYKPILPPGYWRARRLAGLEG